MTEGPEERAEGMNRRDMLRRSALIGSAGVVAWAAPTVTAFAPRAFAQEGTGGLEGEPGTGAPSWTMIWYATESHYFRVKYEANEEGGFSTLCNAQKIHLSANDPTAATYFDAQEAKVGDRVRSTECPPGVSSEETATGSLQIVVEGDIKIIGWVLHDGTCRQIDPEKISIRSAEYHLKDPNDPDLGSAGPAASLLPSASGIFVWQNCEVGLMTTTVEVEEGEVEETKEVESTERAENAEELESEASETEAAEEEPSTSSTTGSMDGASSGDAEQD
jgi:hypothetical protein